jgi:hypothetical protein
MLVVRYFVFVGGALLALLWVVNAELPKPSAAPAIAIASSNDLPVIRINSSERKGPARIVFDTNAPMPVAVAKVDTPVRTPVVAQIAPNQVAPKVTVVHDALARPHASKPRHVARRARKPRRRPVYRRRYAGAREPRYFSRPPMMLVAQQPPFGFFNW